MWAAKPRFGEYSFQENCRNSSLVSREFHSGTYSRNTCHRHVTGAGNYHCSHHVSKDGYSGQMLQLFLNFSRYFSCKTGSTGVIFDDIAGPAAAEPYFRRYLDLRLSRRKACPHYCRDNRERSFILPKPDFRRSSAPGHQAKIPLHEPRDCGPSESARVANGPPRRNVSSRPDLEPSQSEKGCRTS